MYLLNLIVYLKSREVSLATSEQAMLRFCVIYCWSCPVNELCFQVVVSTLECSVLKLLF